VSVQLIATIPDVWSAFEMPFRRLSTLASIAFSILLFLAGCSHKHGGPDTSTKTPASAMPTVARTAPPLASTEADELAGGLAKGTDDGLRSVIAMPSGQQLDAGAAQQLAALAPITFDLSTFQFLDATHATITGHVAHPPPAWHQRGRSRLYTSTRRGK
jgi:hypothetical protein